MARRAIPLVVGKYYHVYNRGNNRQQIFFERENYLFFLRRVGALFQGKFQTLSVDRNEYLLHLSRYIHLNPVEAALVKRAEDWEFSSYREYINLRRGTLPRPDVILAQFTSSSDYRRFVEAYQPTDKSIISHLLLDED